MRNNCTRKQGFFKPLAASALALLVLSSPSMAATTTLTSNGNWLGGAWDNGEPGVGDDAVIGAGVAGTASNSVAPWSGSLTLQAGASLNIISSTNPNPANMAFDGATSIILNNGAFIHDNFKSATFPQPITVIGTAGFDANNNSGNNHGRTFTGGISGDTWVTDGRNHQGYIYEVANTFSSYLIQSTEGQRHGVRFNAAGSAGLGDVTVTTGGTQSAVIILGANNVFALGATLTLNGRGWAGSTGGFGPVASGPWVGTNARIAMQGFDATVSGLVIDGVAQAPGIYTADSGDWIVGAGNLVVIPEPSTFALLGLAAAGLLRRRRN